MLRHIYEAFVNSSHLQHYEIKVRNLLFYLR